MIAILRSYSDFSSQHLATVDLMRYSQNQICQSIENHNMTSENVQVVSFDDWQVSIILSLKQAYQLKSYILHHCNGDESLVKELLKKHWPLESILARRFEFVGEGDLNILTKLFENRSARNIALIVHSMGNASEIIAKFMRIGKIIATPQGFYISKYQEE